MTQAEQLRRDIRPVTACLKGWAFSTLSRRRALVAAAKLLLPALPDYCRQIAADEIASVEAHCLKD